MCESRLISENNRSQSLDKIVTHFLDKWNSIKQRWQFFSLSIDQYQLKRCACERKKVVMKFAVILFAVCLSAYCVSSGQVKEQDWGNVRAKLMGSERVIQDSTMFQVKKHTFVYPKVRVEILGTFWVNILTYLIFISI